MLRTTRLLLLLCILFSCHQQEFDLDRTVFADQVLAAEQHDGTDDLHPSILNSTWWQEKSPRLQQLIGLELQREGKALTMRELNNLLEQAKTHASMRASVCPGFPANPEGDVTLNSQSDVNAFGALNCKEITGALLIEDTSPADPICDLSPLKGLKKVGSSVSVIADCLTNLSGLEKLKSIGELGPFGFVGVIGANLVDISALSKLSVVTGSINVINCDQLTSVTSAFSKITTIESGKSAQPLTSIFVLNIADNAVLTDISAFSSLTYLEGGLRILSNGALPDLDDLSGLSTIGSIIFIFENTALQNVNELSNITSITNDLLVVDNPLLTQCCGLYDLLCSNPPACTSSGVGGAVVISGNGAGCTEADIIAGGPCP